MVLTIVLICCLPVGLVLLVFFAIGTAGARTYRRGKGTWVDFKPFLDNLKDSVSRAQRVSSEFSNRGMKLQQSVEEIGGRWAFIAESLTETVNSPAVKVAGLAGRFASRR
jgi:hypothetical protein